MRMLLALGLILSFSPVIWAEQAYSLLHSFGCTSFGKTPQTALVEDGYGALFGATSAGGRFGKGTIFRLSRDGVDFRDIYDFETGSLTYLFIGSDNRLYVTCNIGGTNKAGTLFRINGDGSGFELLHRFGETATDGKCPYGPVIESDGYLWGTTKNGGNRDRGTLFRLAPDGSDYQVAAHFGGKSGDPYYPEWAVLDGGDGWLYGVSKYGGTNELGIVYRVSKGDSVFEALRGMDRVSGRPMGALVPDDSGYLWGISDEGIYRINRTGTAYKFQALFTGSGGGGTQPLGGIVRGADGAWYGLTSDGGTYGQGTLYRYVSTFNFTWVSLNTASKSGLMASTDGSLYGTTIEKYTTPSMVFRYEVGNATSYLVAAFGSSMLLGSPNAGVIETANGILLGLANSGGSNGAGGIYMLDVMNGTSQTMCSFSYSGYGPNGCLAPLSGATDGYVYGTSSYGGGAGYGTVFRIDASGSGLETLWKFTSQTNEGCFLRAPVIEGEDGYLYGTSRMGGSSNSGTVFRLTKDGADFSVLHHFGTIEQDGREPQGGLVGDGLGGFLGTTRLGGVVSTGTVYRIEANGTYRVLHQFGGPPDDGALPRGALLQATNGFVYGICQKGGPWDDGIIFRLKSDGSAYSVVHAFNNAQQQGRYPVHGLVPLGDQGLYGITSSGGSPTNGGTLFRVGLDGSCFFVLHAFGMELGDGMEPNGLSMMQDGALVGTTERGGAWNKGTVFRVNPSTIEPLAARLECELAPGQLRLIVRGRPQTTYRIEESNNLQEGPWLPISDTVETGLLGQTGIVTPKPGSPRFYRAVTVSP